MSGHTGWPLLAGQGIASAAGRNPDRDAIRLLNDDGGVAARVTYRHLVERMNRLAWAALEGLGLRAGDHAAIVAPNCVEYLEIVCGLGLAGIATATPSPKLKAAEIGAICEDAQARLILVHPDQADAVRSLDLPFADRIIVLGAEYEALLAQAKSTPLPEALLADEMSDFVLHYTSGTTGKPKGVRVTHRSRTLTCYGSGVEFGCYGPDDSFLGIAPLCHGAGFAFGLAPIFFGGTCDLLGKFDPELTLRALKQDRHSGVFMVPTHFHAIFGLEQSVLSSQRPDGLRTIISNAAPLPQATKERIVEYFGDGLLHECYGSTEAGIVSNLRPKDQLRKVKCVGLPFTNTEIKLVDDAGHTVPRGEVGELFSRSPFIFNGYWQKPEETAAALREGWVSAGDLARMDDEGYLYIVDRKKDMIISGGINVYPREIEEVLFQHPAVAEAAVIGLPDDYWGERITAVIVPRNPEEISTESIIDHCRSALADYKRPRDLHCIDALPKNAAGKTLKNALRDMMQGQPDA